MFWGRPSFTFLFDNANLTSSFVNSQEMNDFVQHDVVSTLLIGLLYSCIQEKRSVPIWKLTTTGRTQQKSAHFPALLKPLIRSLSKLFTRPTKCIRANYTELELPLMRITPEVNSWKTIPSKTTKIWEGLNLRPCSKHSLRQAIIYSSIICHRPPDFHGRSFLLCEFRFLWAIHVLIGCRRIGSTLNPSQETSLCQECSWKIG